MTGDYARAFQPAYLHDGRGHRLALAGEEFLGIGREFRGAALGAEVIRRALVVDMARGLVGVDHHPADGIEHALSHGYFSS